ncbi:MAG: TSUP family transporter [Sulfurimicrobium sp.]|nr:TSUP family transporter [Sulfurimicrobium sp.]
METVQFIDLNAATVFLLVLIGFVAGMVSGFIGSGGAFVLTPAMMALGVPGIVAVASNICHKFPKALVGTVKRHKYGQVDIKLGLTVGVFAELGVLYGKHVMTDIKHQFGAVGTDLYVSIVFIVVLAVVGAFVLRDYLKLRHMGHEAEHETPKLAKWVHSVRIPGTMVYFPSIKTSVSLLFIVPTGFATGFLASAIAVGGFVGVPAMIYLLGVPAIMATATELLIAFVMGLGGTVFYGLDGVVDVRLSMLILLGSLFGIQLGAIGSTYIKDYQVKQVMATIMLTVLFSRFFYIPGYLSDLHLISAMAPGNISTLKTLGDSVLAVALILGAVSVLTALTRGIAEHRKAELAGAYPGVVETIPASVNLDPTGRFERIMLATDGSEYSSGAVNVATEMARRNHAKLLIVSVAVFNPEYSTSVPGLEAAADEMARRHAQGAMSQAAGLDPELVVMKAEDPYMGIVEAAEEYRADLIVMGRRGKRGLARAMVGDATARVIGRASCNVLVVPRGAGNCKTGILIATDGSRFSDAAAVTAGKLAVANNLPLTVVSVVLPSHNQQRRQEAQIAVQRVRKGLEKEGLAISAAVVEGGRADEAIVAQARKSGADMIVMGSHGRTGLDRVMLGSVAERVIGRSETPVLVVKAA